MKIIILKVTNFKISEISKIDFGTYIIKKNFLLDK